MQEQKLSPGDGELVLTLDLEPGQNIDALVAAESLIAWVAAIREANSVMDPGSEVAVDLISADAACLRLRAMLRFIEDKALGAPADALGEFPRIKKIVVATVLGVPPGLVVGGLIYLMQPDATVNLSPKSIGRLHEEQQRVGQSQAVQGKVQTFYKTVSRSHSVTNVRVAEGVGKPSLISIPREEFAERSGLWAPQEVAEHERPRREEWDVIVTHPAMKSSPLSWGFERDGLPFNARMEDKEFLAAVHDGTLPIVIQEGVNMRIIVEWVERLHGQTWEVVQRSRKITKVLSPKPRSAPLGSTPLFGDH